MVHKIGGGARTQLFALGADAPLFERELWPGELIIFRDDRFRHSATPLLGSEGGSAQRDAMVCTVTFGEDAIRPLLLSLHDSARHVQVDALAALQVIGPAHPDALLAVLREPDARLRVAAAEAITAVGQAMAPGLVAALSAPLAACR